VSAAPVSALGSDNTGDQPAAAPIAWTALAASRRDLDAKASTATPAATVGTGEPATLKPVAAPVVTPSAKADQVSAPTANAGWYPGKGLRFLVGNGTAADPNAGILIGNGYSYGTAAGDCSGTCNGGNAGLLGTAGNGYNGGTGGAAGLFGPGGNGGDGITAVAGGTGGRGGLIFGDGGQGGAGAPFYAGGNGGSAVLWGAGGAGGVGGLVVYGVGLPGGTGGQGGLLYGATGATGETGATAPVVISDQYGSTTIGNKYVVMNNLYTGIGLQTITVSTTGFTITQETATTPTYGGGPLGYPAVYLGCSYSLCSPSSPLPMPISTITSATSSIDLTYATDTSAVYDAAYDIWLNPTSDTTGQQQQEIMIWLNWQGGAQPVASTYDTNGTAVPIATTTIDGMSWNVYGGTTEEGYENDVFSYLPVTPTPPITSLTNLNLLAFIADTQSRTANYAQPVTDAWYLTSIQAGFEPHSGGIGLAVNSFDATVS
jgi:hypothetical protein